MVHTAQASSSVSTNDVRRALAVKRWLATAQATKATACSWTANDTPHIRPIDSWLSCRIAIGINTIRARPKQRSTHGARLKPNHQITTAKTPMKLPNKATRNPSNPGMTRELPKRTSSRTHAANTPGQSLHDRSGLRAGVVRVTTAHDTLRKRKAQPLAAERPVLVHQWNDPSPSGVQQESSTGELAASA